MSSTPWLLTDNLLDTTVLYPGYTLLSSGGEASGQEPWRVSDNLREITYWRGAPTGPWWVGVDRFASVTVDTIIVDRFSNLLGRENVELQSSADGVTWTTVASFDLAAEPTPLVLPRAANGTVTRERVWWKTLETPVAARAFRLYVPNVLRTIPPIITGLYLGASYRLPDGLVAPSAVGRHRRVQYGRTATTAAGLIVKTDEYGAFDAQVERTLLDSDHVWWFCMDPDAPAWVAKLLPVGLASEIEYQPEITPGEARVDLTLQSIVPAVWR